MFILVAKNDDDLRKIKKALQVVPVCELIKPYKYGRNENERLFMDTSWKYVIHNEKLDGITSVPFENYLNKRLRIVKFSK